MGTRDPNQTARNKIIDNMTQELKSLLPSVLSETGIESQGSLHGIYGGKFDSYMNTRTDIVNSPEEFTTLFLKGLIKKSENNDSAHNHLDRLKKSPSLKKYLTIFLARVYYRNFDALRRMRPDNDENAQIWIGQKDASWGIFITPRFNASKAQWENDGSEIRFFPQLYWTIGHILNTGLVVPGKNEKYPFKNVDDYLNFFLNVLVRNSGSTHEYNLAKIYCDYVSGQKEQSTISLLIPEYRYGGVASAHKYRLDFTIISPYTLVKYGFELSPWSTHGYLSKAKGLTQKAINEMARDNFENEMTKHKDFFNKHHVFSRIYTDRDLEDLNVIFERDMLPILTETENNIKPDFDIIDKLLHC